MVSLVIYLTGNNPLWKETSMNPIAMAATRLHSRSPQQPRVWIGKGSVFMKSIFLLPFLFLLLSIPAFADISPEGCDSLANGDTETNDGGGKEICLKSENVKEGGGDGISTGTFTITISDWGNPIQTHHMTGRWQTRRSQRFFAVRAKGFILVAFYQ